MVLWQVECSVAAGGNWNAVLWQVTGSAVTPNEVKQCEERWSMCYEVKL